MKSQTYTTKLIEAGRKAAVLIAVLLLPLGALASTASVTANCRSLILDEFTNYLSGVGYIYVSTTTFDGLSTYPLGLASLTSTFNNSSAR